jgi:indolepyruvate ferredoxin oxidoreductase
VTTPPLDATYELDHRYSRASGRVFLTGVQALVRLPLLQRERDRAAGLNTAGFISGYRGSPLGTYDLALWEARAHLERADILFQPGVNEDLAATAVWGTQQAMLQPGPTKDGVFAIWYGKGPGVDRSLDPIKHGNYLGTAKHGGVLALCGDDPGAKSSSIAHQSEHAMIHAGIPVLNPASVQEYLDFGLLGFAMSRFAGCWVAMKCSTDTVDSGASVEVGPERVRVATPEFAFPPRDHHITLNNVPLEVERAVFQVKLPAAQAFARANGIDRIALDVPRRRFGIVTTGKAYLDVRQALDELGLGEGECAALGLCIFKVGMSWPLEPSGVRDFCVGLADVLVVEEKRPIVEEQLARILYNEPQRPRLLGKHDESGAPLVPNEGELAPGAVAAVLRGWLARRAPEHAGLLRATAAAVSVAPPSALMRLPSFCSGCPHNTSTVVPEGSIALGGIGCHGMAVWLPERRTFGATQMGGEGANWIGTAPFTKTAHVFQNLGDGTYFHSGLLAIRACVAAGVSITYKILVNGAVAMTGGQPIEGEPLEGEITCPEIARQLVAEGVKRVVVVSHDPAKYAPGAFPAGVDVRHRDELMSVQKQLRETSGVTAIVYDQTCAAEARRLRRQGKLPDPDRRIVINELVCEGCGDCSVQSNCISIEPLETELGRKRRINQSSCNKDYSCVKGYCPSFVSVVGGKLRKAETKQAGVDEAALFAALPEPTLPALDRPYNVLLTGIGGTGVVTVGAILAMAAHLEGRGASELDVTGLAQKNGAVASHVRIASRPEEIHATRIGTGGADLAIGCDPVVMTSFENLPKLSPRSFAVVNSHVQPTAAFATNANLDLSADSMLGAVRAICGDASTLAVDANELAAALLGDALASNMLLLGVAWQRGKLPVGRAALDRAIVLNGRAIEMNRRAFAWGRLLAHDAAAVRRAASPLLRARAPTDASLEALVEWRASFLTAYQNAAYAERYRALVARVAEREQRVAPGHDALARSAARCYFKLLAYKDEYEVARLYSDGSFAAQVAREFEGDYRLSLHLSPQFLPALLAPRDPESGRVKKWMIPMRVMGPAFKALAKLRFLRGTPFDPFGWTRHRRSERAEIGRYEATLGELLDGLTRENLPFAVEIASLPELVRGFDSVKEQHLEAARHKQLELLVAFRRA